MLKLYDHIILTLSVTLYLEGFSSSSK